jgi:hypothetical protein
MMDHRESSFGAVYITVCLGADGWFQTGGDVLSLAWTWVNAKMGRKSFILSKKRRKCFMTTWKKTNWMRHRLPALELPLVNLPLNKYPMTGLLSVWHVSFFSSFLNTSHNFHDLQ